MMNLSAISIRRFASAASLALALSASSAAAPIAAPQHSVARQWNELLLGSIRRDYARPTVHARNLFHVSAATYDGWATYDPVASTIFFEEDHATADPSVDAWRSEAISHACYHLLRRRFSGSPGANLMMPRYDLLMDTLGYDKSNVSLVGNDPAAVGNRIAHRILEFGATDGSNQDNGYENLYYEPINEPLIPSLPGNPTLLHPNRWQELSLSFFIDQSGHPVPDGYPPFLSPEWGNVKRFCMSDHDVTIAERDGDLYKVFKDPGAPPYYLENADDLYRNGFEMVSVWAAHLDPSDGVMIDASPASIGNAPLATPDQTSQFYDYYSGGDWGPGYTVNPVTGQPYATHMVPRGDYARVLAEFWADGPDSETPPGHWFVLLNTVSDHPSFQKRIGGVGPVVNDLEWCAKSYMTMGGAMHDSAIAAWSVKGWYDYLRPVSAIRYLAGLGQCTDPNLPSYSPDGINLHPHFIDVVTSTTTAPGGKHEHLAGEEGKIALYSWRGPDYINDPETDVAGVGWILAENWWPYQRPSFVTPPFAGYVSGHSTYSRAAAVVMHELTGSPWFPDGLGEFVCEQNEFLVFEDGPSVEVRLQWASYYDASDQCSLSRIWGGIHPSADDLPGRAMGQEIGERSVEVAESYWGGTSCSRIDGIELLGIGSPGEGDICPILSIEGCPEVGEFLDVSIRAGSSSGGRGVLLIARGGPQSELLGPYTMFVKRESQAVPFLLTATPGEPGSGEANLTIDPSLYSQAGTDIVLQAVLIDPSTAAGFTVSNGVQVDLE